jgi:phage-related protein
MTNLKEGFTDKWGSLKSWLNDVPGKIKSAIGSISLASIGRSILNSLFDGMRSAWENSKAWLSSLGGKIKDLKGPIEKDRRLLIPEGGAIMDSLGTGLQKNWGGVESWLASVSVQIRDTMRASQALSRALSYQSANTIMNENRAAGARNEQGRGGTQVIINGNLEFPNISDGNDAEEFIANLEALARGR